MPPSTTTGHVGPSDCGWLSPLTITNPATEELVARYDQHSDSEVEMRIARTQETFDQWRRSSLPDRAELIRNVAKMLGQRRDRYATLMTTEMGKPISQGKAEIDKCATLCQFYADNAQGFLSPLPKAHDESAGSSSEVHFEPLGTVLAIMPWNFPFWQVFRFAVPSLMAGNVGLLKHSANVTGTALAIEALLSDAGLPAGALNTLLISSDRVAGVIAHDAVCAVTLTGSERAGVAVASEAGKYLKKSVLELGGSDPFVVLADADVDRVAKQAALARTINSGQSCIAAKRFIVEETIADSFQTAFVREMNKLSVGDPMQESTDIGPLARKDLAEALHEQVIRSSKAGAEILTGGHQTSVQDKGFYYAPTVLGNVGSEAIEVAAFQEETFGPVAIVVRAEDTETAINLANHSRFGLGASIWTSDPGRGKELAKEIQAGSVFINEIVKSDPLLPFGGIKKSGYGRELSDFGIREFVNIKTLRVNVA